MPAAFLSLFRLVTLDNWADLFNTQLAHVPGIKVAIYFVTFIVFGTMIILNLFIGIIMNSMAEMHAEQANEASEKSAAGSDAIARLEQVSQNLAELQSALAGLRHQLETDRRPSVAES